MPRKPDHRCACGKFATAERCRECLHSDTDPVTEAELDAIIAEQRSTMPPDDERLAANNGRTVNCGRDRMDEGYTPPARRFVRFDRRRNRSVMV
jgi:hypothetical protein